MNIPHKNWIEWAVFGAGLLLLLAVAGYLVYEMATGTTTPAQLTVALGEPERTGDHYMVPVTVENAGETSAENVLVEVSVAGSEPLRSMLQLAFVPRGSSSNGWVVFPTQPAAGQLQARVLGYEEP
jgi:uncharacterized protein (TIGR02588 family)